MSAVSEMRLQATTLKHSRRLTHNLSDLLHFLISARAVLPPSEFRDVFDHVSPRMWLHYDVKLPYQICFAIPLLTPPLKNRLQTVFSDLVRNAPLPLPVKEYIISALRIVGCRTPTIGSLLLDGAMKMPTAYVLHLSHSDCNCSSLPDSLPRSRSHVFIRDFHTLDRSDFAQLGIDPVYWNQNMKNATIPDWNTIEDQIRRKLFVALKDLPTQSSHGAFQFNNIVDAFVDECQSAFLATYSDSDKRIRVDAVKAQRSAVCKQNLCAGIFDKATQCAWISCSVLAMSLWVGCFLADTRKKELLRCHTHTEARFLLVTHLLFSVQAILGKLPACNRKVWARYHPLYQPGFVTCLSLPPDVPRSLSGEYLHAWDEVFRANAKWTTFRSRPFDSMRLRLCASDPHANLCPPLVFFDADRDNPLQPVSIPCPSSDLLIKYKSLIYEGLYKQRELATHHKHPWRTLSRKMGRALTIFWKHCVKGLDSHELISMSDILHWSRRNSTAFHSHGVFLELDLCEMFMSIPRDRLLPALKWLFTRLFPDNQKRPLWFSVSMDGNRKRDGVGFKSREFFNVYSSDDLYHFIHISLTIDVLFVGGSSVFCQLTGVPTGGSLSAQLASLFLLAYKFGKPAPCHHLLPFLRYRDNTLFYICAEWAVRVLGRTRAFQRLLPPKPVGKVH